MTEGTDEEYGVGKAEEQSPSLVRRALERLRKPQDSESEGRIGRALDTYADEIQTARFEVGLGELTLGQEAQAFAESIVPSILGTFKPKNLAAGAAELAPLPFTPWWAVGDVIGVVRGLTSLNKGKPIEGTLKLITAAIPAVPTAPTHEFINNWMANRTTVVDRNNK